MTEGELKDRLRRFGSRIMRLADALPPRRSADVIGRQLIRCGTSVGANYRAACRAKSAADFINKLAIAEEEADESAYWLSLLADSGLIAERRLSALRLEADELVAILVASIKTARARANQHSRRRARSPQFTIQNPKSKIQNGAPSALCDGGR